MNTDPTDVGAALARATFLCDRSRWDEAASIVRPLLAVDPQHHHALCLLALTQANTGAYDEALVAALAAISVEPEGEWAYRLASASMTGLGRHLDAVAMARRSVALAPRQAEGFRQLARALVAQGHDLAEARSAAHLALSLAPDSVASFVTVGNVEAASGHRAEAEAAYRQALRIDPNSSVAHNELARLTLRAHRFGSPTKLAAAAGGFATAARSDPRARVSRRNLDLVVHLFLARSAYLIFVAAYVAARLTGPHTPPAARAVPAVALLIPAVYALKFLSQLSPQLRRYVRDFLRNPYVIAALCCDGLAIVAVVIGAAVTRLDTTAFITAAVLAVLARLSLWRTRTVQLGAPDRPPLLSAVSLVLIALALLLVAVGCVLAYTSEPGASPVSLYAAGVAALAFLTCGWVLIRRRTAGRVRYAATMPFGFSRKATPARGSGPAIPVSTVTFDPADGVPAVAAALSALANGDWRSIENAWGDSRDWDTRGAIVLALGELDPIDEWLAACPRSALAHAVRGSQLRRLAWTVRGSGKADGVARSAWGDFSATLSAAEQSLQMAVELNPGDPDPWTHLIWTGTGLQVPTDEKLRRFSEMQQRDAGYLFGWTAITSAVAQKWSGSHQLMFDIARQGNRDLPVGSVGRVGIVRAHEERRLYYANWENDADGAKNYFKRPDVAAEISAAASNSVFAEGQTPRSTTRIAQSWFAYALAMVGDGVPSERLRAASLFLQLGTDGIPDQPWATRYGQAGADQYARIRALCYQAAGIRPPNA